MYSGKDTFTEGQKVVNLLKNYRWKWKKVLKKHKKANFFAILLKMLLIFDWFLSILISSYMKRTVLWFIEKQGEKRWNTNSMMSKPNPTWKPKSWSASLMRPKAIPVTLLKAKLPMAAAWPPLSKRKCGTLPRNNFWVVLKEGLLRNDVTPKIWTG